VRNWHERDRPVSPATQAGIDRAADILRDAGATVADVKLPSLFDFQAANFVILTCEAYSLHEPWMRERFHDYGDLLRSRMVFGGLFAASDYMQAQRFRRELCAATSEASRDVDLLLTAGAPGEAPRILNVPKWDALQQPGFTAPMNQTGWPAMCVPSGFGEGGLPVAVQICAKPFQEATLFQAANVLEHAMSERAKRPALAC
jgi:aspartyl-tRNA(Asn)/glutamyl-tRNA(Gln) amidotransferase subunit A